MLIGDKTQVRKCGWGDKTQIRKKTRMRHPIRTLQPNKVISSSKLLGLLHFWGSALFYIHEIPIPVSYWNCQTLSAIILSDHNVRIRLLKTTQRAGKE